MERFLTRGVEPLLKGPEGMVAVLHSPWECAMRAAFTLGYVVLVGGIHDDEVGTDDTIVCGCKDDWV